MAKNKKEELTKELVHLEPVITESDEVKAEQAGSEESDPISERIESGKSLTVTELDVAGMSMEDVRALADIVCDKYSEATVKSDYKAMNKLDESCAFVTRKYTELARNACYSRILQTEDPMMTAIMELGYETIKTKDEKSETNSSIVTRTIVPTSRDIDLIQLNKMAKNIGGIGRRDDWVHKIQKFTIRMTYMVAIDLGIDPKEINNSLEMNMVVKQTKLAKLDKNVKDPTSRKSILVMVDDIIASMIGAEYKAKSWDVAYAVYAFSKKSSKGALTIACSNHKATTRIMAEICHRIVTGGSKSSYRIESKEFKKAK